MGGNWDACEERSGLRAREGLVRGRILPGLGSSLYASRKLSPVLAACHRQLEEGPGCFSKSIRTARQEIHLAAPTADPGLDPSQPDAYSLSFELLRDLAGPEPAATLGTRLLCEFDHRLCPRLDGVAHHGGWGM